MKQPPIETSRLILRPFHPDDAKRTAEMAGEAAIASGTLRIPHPYTEAMAAEWIGTHAAMRKKGTALYYAIVLGESGEMVGSAGLELDLANGRAELGYWIGKAYWGSGFATEAAAGLLGLAFGDLGLHKVAAHHFASNRASGRVLRKIGMKREGRLRGHIKRAGKWEDVVQYGIMDHEYLAASGDKGG